MVLFLQKDALLGHSSWMYQNVSLIQAPIQWIQGSWAHTTEAGAVLTWIQNATA